jgi:tetratricopeptide (TPR) repeat protein
VVNYTQRKAGCPTTKAAWLKKARFEMRHQIFQWGLALGLLGLIACGNETTFVTTRSSHALGYYQTGLSHLYFSEFPEARQSFENAVQIDPLFRMGYCRLSMACYFLGDQDKAFENNYMATKNILMLDPDEQEFIDWWNAYLNQDAHAARAGIEQLHQKKPFNKEFSTFLAANLIENELTSTADEIFKEILVVDENYLPALLGLGELNYRIEKLDSAQFWLEKALQAAPDKSVTHLHLGQFYLATGQYENALKMLEKSCTIVPLIPESFFQLALLHKELGNYRGALNFFQKYQQENNVSTGSCSIARSLEAEIYYLMNNFPEARKKSLEALELDANNLQAYYWLGRVHLAENRFDEVYSLANQMKLLSTSILPGKSTNAAWYYGFMSQIYLDQGQLDQALSEAAEATAGAHRFQKLDFRIITGKILLASGNFDRALEVCQTIFEKNPWYPPAHFLFAEIQEQQGNFHLAQEHYQTLLKLYQKADDILPTQKARIRLAILKKKQPAVQLTRIAQE